MDMDKELADLLDKIDCMPTGAAKLELLENAARIADTLNDINTAFQIRADIIQVAIFSGNTLKAVTAFSWCLKAVDENKDNDDFFYESDDILWEYKWICGNFSEFYEVEKDKILELLEDYKKRILEEGYGLYSYYYLMMRAYDTFRDKDETEKYYNLFLTTKRDGMGDCNACVADGTVQTLLFLNKYDEALKKADKIINEKMSCAEVPHFTYSNLLLSAYQNKDFVLAERCAKTGYALIKSNPAFLGIIGNYIVYYTMVNIDEAVKLYIKHLNWTFNPYIQPLHKLHFNIAAAMLFSNINATELKLKLPSGFELYDGTGTYSIQKLYDYHYNNAITLVEKFNKRNKNDGYTKYLENIMNFGK